MIFVILIFYFFLFLAQIFVLNESIVWNIWIIIDLVYQIRKINWIICIVSIKFFLLNIFFVFFFILIELLFIIIDLILAEIILKILWNHIFRLWISENLILFINHMKLPSFCCNCQLLGEWDIKIHCLILILHSWEFIFNCLAWYIVINQKKPIWVLYIIRLLNIFISDIMNEVTCVIQIIK